MAGETKADENYGGIIEEAQRNSFDPDIDNLERGGGLPDPTLSTNTTKTETVHPRHVLVCVDCETYFKQRGDWEFCPQCAEELVEVEKA